MIYYRKTLFGSGPKLTAVHYLALIQPGINCPFAASSNATRLYFSSLAIVNKRALLKVIPVSFK